MSQQKIINLKYLREISDGEPVMIREIIEMFISQVPEFIENLKLFLNEKRYVELGKEAHKAKSSVMIVGMDQLGKRLKELQLLTEHGEGSERYQEYVEEFINLCNQSIIELEEELRAL
ncbi:MAG: Hpt domain-containing protein [Bacteroidota bacterium]|nr:Hpt domain-containing protein [Bacteroidota bacterium]MDP4205007.1 Hpt domain-containing protein [Bacteroidota bacterium]